MFLHDNAKYETTKDDGRAINVWFLGEKAEGGRLGLFQIHNSFMQIWLDLKSRKFFLLNR